jgi:hypothetical protein
LTDFASARFASTFMPFALAPSAFLLLPFLVLHYHWAVVAA